MLNLTAIAIGGAIGALLRYSAGLFFSRSYHGHFPLDTLIVNVAGSFLIGLFAGMGNIFFSEHIRQFLMTGICGALTTFSTFSLNTFQLFSNGLKIDAAVNITLSLILCIGAAALGLHIIR